MPQEDIPEAVQPAKKNKKKRNKKKKLVTRLTDPYAPISGPQAIIVPQESEYSFLNSLDALEMSEAGAETNFHFKGGKGTLREFCFTGGQRWVKFDPERAVKTIEICHRQHNEQCYGLRLLDSNKVVIAETYTGYFTKEGYEIYKIELEEGEKIVGIKCSQDHVAHASVFDLQFVLGKMV